MPGFLAPLRIEEICGDDRRWKLLEPCVYHLGSPLGREWVEAPTGMETDFGSIPQVLWWIPGLSPFGKYRRAYVIHDKLFVAPVIRSKYTARVCTFEEANDVLDEAIEVLGAGRLIRRIVHAGVSSPFGRRAWNKHRRADALPTDNEAA